MSALTLKFFGQTQGTTNCSVLFRMSNVAFSNSPTHCSEGRFNHLNVLAINWIEQIKHYPDRPTTLRLITDRENVPLMWSIFAIVKEQFHRRTISQSLLRDYWQIKENSRQKIPRLMPVCDILNPLNGKLPAATELVKLLSDVALIDLVCVFT